MFGHVSNSRSTGMFKVIILSAIVAMSRGLVCQADTILITPSFGYGHNDLVSC